MSSDPSDKVPKIRAKDEKFIANLVESPVVLRLVLLPWQPMKLILLMLRLVLVIVSVDGVVTPLKYLEVNAHDAKRSHDADPSYKPAVDEADDDVKLELFPKKKKPLRAARLVAPRNSNDTGCGATAGETESGPAPVVQVLAQLLGVGNHFLSMSG